MGLKVENLSCERGGIKVLEGVSFDLSPGQALILRGPNGIGKTTLLRTIAGLQPETGGHIEMPEDTHVYGGHLDGLKSMLTVRENLDFWAGVFGTQGVCDVIVRFNLENLSDRPAQNLSAGQKRRLGLARLLVSGRPLWLLDEPTVSLDREHVDLFADLVREHLNGGGMAIMATHIDLGLGDDLNVLELSPFKARPGESRGGFEEAFQ